MFDLHEIVSSFDPVWKKLFLTQIANYQSTENYNYFRNEWTKWKDFHKNLQGS